MGRRRNTRSTRKGKCVQHILPQIDLPENSSAPETRSPSGFVGTNEQSVAEVVIIEQNSDNDEGGPFRLITDPEEHISSDNEDLNDETDLRSHKRKKDTEEDDNNKKKTRILSTITNLHSMQKQMFTMIQDIQQNVDEMYTDWKTNGGFGSSVENDMKWIEDVINQAIYTTAEKVKYPSDEFIMQICYDALINAGNDNFNKKMKNGGSWKRFFNKHIRKIAQRFCRQARSNIVQHVKDAVHAEFMDLEKPKTENRQVTREAEKKFKDSKITRDCYRKLNQPIDPNNDPHYTHLNSIIDRVFTSSNTEKNSIAFGMTVALNYLDPLKGINMVPSEVIERMNNFLEKMNVIDREELD